MFRKAEISVHRMKRELVKCALLILLAGRAVCSCSKQAPQMAVVAPKAFNGDPPAIEEAWDRALEAAGQNDFATAIQTLRQLNRQGTTLDQNKTAFAAIVVYEGNQ